MLSKVHSFGLFGIEGFVVEVEVDIVNGLPHFEIVGLADTAIKEAKERVKANSWEEPALSGSSQPIRESYRRRFEYQGMLFLQQESVPKGSGLFAYIIGGLKLAQ